MNRADGVDDAPSFLHDDAPPVLIFGGKGGVGKTTSACAAAIALARAHPGESVVLVSTDPAHSVRDALGAVELPGNLRVEEPDASAEHDAFMVRHGGVLREIASRGTFLDDADIERFLDLSLPGVDELMNFLTQARWFEDEAADRYVVDTAPTGHALRLLAMPGVTGGWLDAVEALLGKHRYMASVFGGGAADPVEAFVEELEAAFDNIAAVWTEPDLTRFVPVFNAEPLSIAETARLLGSLDEMGVAAPELVLNRLVPDHATGSLASLRSAQEAALADLPEIVASRTLVRVPLFATEPRANELASFFLMTPDRDAPTLGPDAGSADQPVPAPASAPAQGSAGDLVSGSIRPAQRVTLVAGKGGVGKTTVACSLALASHAGKTLLVSTDPAGSLSDALRIEVGPEPAPVTPTLDVVQLDADRELQALKDLYADEIESFFDGMAVDLSFDREALEQLLELAPSGLDEVMALVRMTEVLEAGEHDALIIDTAPTGHTLRLLELPEVVQAWLQQIFAVLLKYEGLLRLPRLNDRLLKLSRGLKQLRAMLADADQTGVVVVTVPTGVAGDETARLLEGCAGLGIPVSGVVVNQLTSAGDDDFSAGVAAREARELQRLASAAGATPIATIKRGGDLRGVHALRDLGHALAERTHETRSAA